MMRLLGLNWRLELIYPVPTIIIICWSVGLCRMGAGVPVTRLNNGLKQIGMSCVFCTEGAAQYVWCVIDSRGYDGR